MKTVKIPGIVVLMIPFIIYIIYWFIMQSIDVFNDMSLCYCTSEGLREAPPGFWERFFNASLVIVGMFVVLAIIEYIINIWTKHIKDDMPFVFVVFLFIPGVILVAVNEGFKYINDKLTLNIKY